MSRLSGACRLGLSQFFQLPFNVSLTRALPLNWLRLYIRALGLLYFLFSKKDRSRLFQGLHHVLGPFYRPRQFYRLVLKAFVGVFDHYFEKLAMAHKPVPEMMHFLGPRLRIANPEHLDRIAKAGRGGLLVTGHFGAVEFLPMALVMHGYKVAMICRFKTAHLRRELMAKAQKDDVVLIDADEPKVAFKALEAIKGGRILITECDEFSEWRPSAAQNIKVFGSLVPQDKTLDFFYRRAKVPAVLGLMRRDGDGVTLCIEPLGDGRPGPSLAQAAWRSLERHILKYPQQWYQWKNAVRDLAPYINWEKRHAYQERPYLPAEHTVLPANLA